MLVIWTQAQVRFFLQDQGIIWVVTLDYSETWPKYLILTTSSVFIHVKSLQVHDNFHEMLEQIQKHFTGILDISTSQLPGKT